MRRLHRELHLHRLEDGHHLAGAPASILSMPSTIQPGVGLSWGGMKRRKSTCSPICGSGPRRQRSRHRKRACRSHHGRPVHFRLRLAPRQKK
jgi:hypothetical protein